MRARFSEARQETIATGELPKGAASASVRKLQKSVCCNWQGNRVLHPRGGKNALFAARNFEKTIIQGDFAGVGKFRRRLEPELKKGLFCLFAPEAGSSSSTRLSQGVLVSDLCGLYSERGSEGCFGALLAGNANGRCVGGWSCRGRRANFGGAGGQRSGKWAVHAKVF